MTGHAPVILREGDYSEVDVVRLREKPIWRVVDIVERQLADLFEIMHPSLKSRSDFDEQLTRFLARHLGSKPELAGDWIYYPWSGILLHCATEGEQFLLRTNRNHNLITPPEQSRLANSRVAIAGLSVGSSVAVGLAYSGFSKLSLADFDLLETPNLNRVQASLSDIGINKAELTAQRIYSVNPYADLTLYSSGISAGNLQEFLGGKKPVDVVFDEIDDFEMKVQIRRTARKMHIPVVMLTGLGDSVLIDIERYDREPELPIFNGLIKGFEEKLLAGNFGQADINRYAAQIVGLDNVPTRAIESLLEIGKSLMGRPQLGSTVAIDGGLGPYIVRKIMLGAPLQSGRYRMSLNQIFLLEDEVVSSRERSEAVEKLINL